jgi:BlaI family transcriptional regulator, penicillinase repressor
VGRRLDQPAVLPVAGLLSAAGLAASAASVGAAIASVHRASTAAVRVDVVGLAFSYPRLNRPAWILLGLALVGGSGLALVVRALLRQRRAYRRFLAQLEIVGQLDERPDVHVIADPRPQAFCAGYLRSTVYVSQAAVGLLARHQLEAVLAHEDHHRRMRDPLRFAFGRILSQGLFFVPGLRALFARYADLAELRADAAAVRAAAGGRAALASALLAFDASGGGVSPQRVDSLLGLPAAWRHPRGRVAMSLGALAMLMALTLVTSRTASAQATFNLPLVSSQPCLAVLVLLLGPYNYAASAARVILKRVARSRTPKPPPALHELEAEIMEEVWRQGEPTTVKLVMDALNRKAKPARAYTTYMTVMRRLSDKGLLSRRRSGRSDTYEAALTREQYQDRRAGAEVRDLVDQFGDAALAHFARSLSTLDPAQQRRLRRLASGE